MKINYPPSGVPTFEDTGDLGECVFQGYVNGLMWIETEKYGAAYIDKGGTLYV
jgi:hypothetical protein